MQICKVALRNFVLNAELRPSTVPQTPAFMANPQIMALSSPPPNSLEALPGEAPKPPLRLLERRLPQAARPAARAQADNAVPWLQVWRRWVG